MSLQNTVRDHKLVRHNAIWTTIDRLNPPMSGLWYGELDSHFTGEWSQESELFTGVELNISASIV